ncbi:Uncharacterised protein [Mycobacteroides abscessus subsp. bolletii]|uniref:hypothetical protein n=1 Tax=Mycobacteroides abscessus TaxID=36809 RepID=UPI0009D51286|nr:hypothetical protein [Mycobacteroides abscessus]SKX71465.1 Uncharacterised protein [Mycobacteroides abscessus subsp. bolletii]
MSLPAITGPAEGLVIDLVDLDLLIDRATNLATLAAGDTEQALAALPGDVPLFSVVDLSEAMRHLRAAVWLLDRAADRIAGGGR